MLTVTYSGCFEYEFVKVLRSDNLFGTLTQTSKDSPNAICPFGNPSKYPSDAIGSALYSPSGLSSLRIVEINMICIVLIYFYRSFSTNFECYYCNILKMLKLCVTKCYYNQESRW
jgi:hypothetical protein